MIIKELQEFEDFDSWGESLFLNKREKRKKCEWNAKEKGRLA